MNKTERLKEQIRKEREKYKEIKRKREEKEKQTKLKEELEIQRKEFRIENKKITPEGIKDIFRKRKIDKLVVINMKLRNDSVDTFYISESGESFKYAKRPDKLFIFDETEKYYNIKFKHYCYDYHEDCSLPYSKTFPIKDVETAVHESPMVETEYALNPSVLKRFMNTSIIEMMLRGGAIDKIIRIIVVIIAIVLLISVVHMVLYMNQTGMFENLL